MAPGPARFGLGCERFTLPSRASAHPRCHPAEYTAPGPIARQAEFFRQESGAEYHSSVDSTCPFERSPSVPPASVCGSAGGSPWVASSRSNR